MRSSSLYYFFRHFESLDQLLMEVLDEGLAELLVHIETLAKGSETSALETEGRLSFEYIKQRADLFRILFKNQGVTRVRKRVVQNIAVIFQKSCAPLARSNSQMTIAITSRLLYWRSLSGGWITKWPRHQRRWEMSTRA